MADELDAMLQGDDTAPASPAQTEGQQIEQQSDEEVEFNSLSGSSQDRIRELVKRAKEAENKLGSLSQDRYVPPAPNLEPDQKQALETLSKFGVATDEKVDQKLSEAFNQLRWDRENDRLSDKYSGSNGEPQYVREEVEDYIRNHPQYQGYAAEDVFRFKMFPDEFTNLEVAKHTSSPKRSSSFRPTKSQGMNTSTINSENVEEMVKSHDQAWYEEHLEEINAAVAAHTNSFKGKNFGGQ